MGGCAPTSEPSGAPVREFLFVIFHNSSTQGPEFSRTSFALIDCKVEPDIELQCGQRRKEPRALERTFPVMTPTNLIEETPALSERAPRIVGTPAAVALINQLKQQHGSVMFHQSGGCCDGSAPLCFRLGEFRVSAQDVHLGDIDGAPFYVGASQYKYLADTPLTLDIVPGDIDSFSLEAGGGFRFITRATDQVCGAPPA